MEWQMVMNFRWTIPSLSYSALLSRFSFGIFLSYVMQQIWVDLPTFCNFHTSHVLFEPNKCSFIFMCQCLMVCNMEKLNGKVLFHTATSTQCWADDTALHTLCLPLPINPEAVSISNNPFGLTEQLACCCIVETDWRAIRSDSKERNAVTSHKKCDTVTPHQLEFKGMLCLRD